MLRSFVSSYVYRLMRGLIILALVTSGFTSASAGSIRVGMAQLASAPITLRAQIYTDTLTSIWQDWSWDSTVNLNNIQPVHSGSASIAVTYNAAWAGFYLHTETAFSTSDYSAIRFWVHGGSTGGQSVNFQLLNGGPSYPFTVQANTWTLVTIPFASLGNPDTFTDLVWQDGSGHSQPTFYLDDISLVEVPRVYADALANGFEDWSWDTTTSFDNTQPVHSGDASIAVTYTEAWAGFYLHSDAAIPTAGFTSIQFWVHGGSTGGQSVNFFQDSGSSYAFTVQPNTWSLITVPLAAIGNPATLSALTWQDASGHSQPTFYLDDISLIETSPGTWAAANSPVTYPLRSVAMLSTSDGWAVGFEGYYPDGDRQGSVMLRWNGNMWNEWGSDSSGSPLFSVTTISNSDGWAVGNINDNDDEGEILRWNGSTWNSVHPPGGETLNSVAMVSANDGWAVGGGGMCQPGLRLVGTIMRWNGGAWSAGSITDIVLNSVAMDSASDGWAVGYYCYASMVNGNPTWDSDSAILHWDGSSWNEVGSPTYLPLNSVAMLSAANGWAVGMEGTILHWNGSAWSWLTSPTSCDLASVAMVSVDDGWAVGGGGTDCPSQPSVILHWNGITWSEISSPISQKLNSVVMISANDGWAVGQAGTILHYTNSMNLSVIKTGTGNGTVTSSPAGINCGSACYTTFDSSTSVTLTAQAVTGSTFTGWSGSVCPGTDTCTVTLDAVKSVTANFTQPCFTLNLAHSGNGSDPIASPLHSRGCSNGQYVVGEQVFLTAGPSVGWQVGSWLGTDNDSSTSTYNTLWMPASDQTVTVNYIQITFNVYLPLVRR